MVHDLARLRVDRPCLDRLDVAILGQAGRRGDVREQIGTGRRHIDRPGSARPDPACRSAHWSPSANSRCGRHVGRVAARRAGVDPLDDRRDVLVGQRRIVLELLDADVSCRCATAASRAPPPVSSSRAPMAALPHRSCSDIGAISPGRWHVTQERWRIGATSLVNVTCCAASGAEHRARPAMMPGMRRRVRKANLQFGKTLKCTPTSSRRRRVFSANYLKSGRFSCGYTYQRVSLPRRERNSTDAVRHDRASSRSACRVWIVVQGAGLATWRSPRRSAIWD